MARTALINAHLLDAAEGLDGTGHLVIDGEQIIALGSGKAPATDNVIDCTGLTLCPGLIDSRVFKVDGPAAQAGGITRVCLMPDQSPVLDDPAMIERAIKLGRKQVWVHPLVAATVGLAGQEMAEIGLALKAGACAISTGRQGIESVAIMMRLMQYASAFDAVLVTHAEEQSLAEGSCATDSEYAMRLGLPSQPTLTEWLRVERDIALAETTGVRLHIGQVTTARSVEAVRSAKARGLRVTCGVTPAHLLLNDLTIDAYRSFSRLSPPLRTEPDRQAVLAGLVDGTIDVLASGHDPRTEEDKRLPFAHAEPGMVGLETLLALALVPVHNGQISLARALALMTTNPARLFGLPAGRLAVGAPADLLLFDPDAPWKIRAEDLKAQARNTPFDGLPVAGRVAAVWQAGRLVNDQR